MSDNRIAGFSKDPLAPSHGESLADQSFQSLKSKEIRDSMSPTEMKFHSMTLNNPNTTGWNVQSSSEVSPDGRGFRAETIATTDGVEHLNGGTAEFKGRNEQRSSAMHEGDDRNFVKKASESSNTHLHEKVVLGDENSGRTEVRTSSSTSTSSSKVFQSSSTTDYENGQPVRYLTDTNRAPQRLQEPHYKPMASQYEPQDVHDVRHVTDQSTIKKYYDQQTEQYRHNRHETNTSENVQTNETHEQNKRYVDMDKASPEYQRHVQHLMQQPGEIISNTVEYPKPNVKMITTVKRLPDGTIVRNKRYETEETKPTPSQPTYGGNTRQQTSTNQTTNISRESQTNQQTKNYREPSDRVPAERYQRPDDIVDNVETQHYTHDTHSDNVSNVETKYSTVKTSNRKFSTETTSEHVEEYDDRHEPTSPNSRSKPVTNSFSTHGFPSVRPNKPTQEFATDRPNLGYPSQNYAAPRDKLVPSHGVPSQNVVERRIPTSDGEVIILSSEKRHNVKHQTNTERVIETDVRTTDDNRYQNVCDVTNRTTQDFTTHGYPSVNEPVSHPKSEYEELRQVRPSGPNHAPGTPGTFVPDNTIVTSQRMQTSKHNMNTERIIETEIIGDDGRPRLISPGNQGQPRSPTTNYTVTTPGTGYSPSTPHHDFSTHGHPSVKSPSKPKSDYPSQGYPSARSPNQTTPVTAYSPNTPNQDFSTHGYPSVKSPSGPKPDYPSQGYPSARSPTRATPGYASPKSLNKPRGSSPSKTSPSTKKTSTTIETTERVIQKEKEVDAAHRAFAASLRSSSPVDNSPRRDSYSTDGPRHTPRSSVSSTRTFKRDMREGSHDSAAGSEFSRISNTTMTRQTPPKTTSGGRTVVTKQTVITTKNGNENLSATSPRGSKSPSPGKTVTTTTTTRTVTSKASPRDAPKTETSPQSSPAPSSRSSPYPFKSKGPQGEDDQSIDTYNSRPLSPSSPTRSTKPNAYKDIPTNSRGPKPSSFVRDGGRTDNRDTLIETTNIDEYIEEDVNSLQNMKKPRKPLVSHEIDEVTKRRPSKSTEPKTVTPVKGKEQPKPNDQKQPTKSKPVSSSTSTTFIVTERKVQTPKNVGPQRRSESPKKPQAKPSERHQLPKQYDEENEPIPVTDDDEDLTAPNMRETTEISIKTTAKKNVKNDNEINTNRTTTQTKKFVPVEKDRDTKKPTKQRFDQKEISTVLIENERFTQNIGPNTKPKYDDDECSPKKPQSPIKHNEKVLITTTKRVDDLEENISNKSTSRTPIRSPSPTKKQNENILNKTTPLSPTRSSSPTKKQNVPSGPMEYESPENDKPKTIDSDTQENYSETEYETMTTSKQDKIINEKTVKKLHDNEIEDIKTPDTSKPKKGQVRHTKDRSPDLVSLSESEDEFVKNNYRENNTIIVETVNKRKDKTIPESDYNRLSPEKTGKEPETYYSELQRKKTTTKTQPNQPLDKESEYPQVNPKNTKSKPDTYHSVDSEPQTKTAFPETYHNKRPKEPLVDKPIKSNVVETIKISEEKVRKNDSQKPDVCVVDSETEPERDVFESTLTKYKTDKIQTEKTSKDIHEQFVKAEQTTHHPERPDGAFISKTDEPVEPKSPTYKKKGVSRRDTFEDRCRQILGMENYGDTPGTFKSTPVTERTEPIRKPVSTNKEKLEKSVYEVKIEDCGDDDDDDQPNTIKSVRNNVIEKKTEHSDTKITDNGSKLYTTDKNIDKTHTTNTSEEIHTIRPNEQEPNTSDSVTQKKVEISEKLYPTKPLQDTPSYSNETVLITTTTKRVDNMNENILNKSTPRSPTRSPSPTKKQFAPSGPEEFETIVSDETRSPSRSPSPTKKQFNPSGPEEHGRIESNEPRSPSRSPSPTKKQFSPTRPEEIDRSENNKPYYEKASPTRSPTKTKPKTESEQIENITVFSTKYKSTEIDETNDKVFKKPSSRTPIRSPSPTKKTPLSEQTGVITEKTKNTTVFSEKYESSEIDEINDDVFKKTTSRTPIRSPSPSKKTPLSEPTGFVTEKIVTYEEDVSSRPTSRSPSKSVPLTGEQDTPKKKPSDKSTSPIMGRFESRELKNDNLKTTKTKINENISETTTIKDRLRSSQRKDKSPKKTDQVDNNSSPETSPTRFTERRRSSNISVNTEIIIEHTDTDTKHKKTETKPKPKTKTDSVYREIVETTRVPEKMPKKIPVTERKESAPVHRVTRKDKDSKMSRSTSENIIKVKKSDDINNSPSHSPKPTTKTPDHRRPNKCFTTKTINLSTTDRLMTSDDIDNVIIDIQQAKSSREPSPNKIVPTPVPAHIDTGKPRYPDVVQEPEEEPRKKPVIKNIPIFEEDQNSYVGCHITEVNIEKTRKTHTINQDDEILNTPVVEAPQSLDYTQPSEVNDDECLLSVHDKVSKFQHIANEVTKPKTSSPFNREFDDSTQVPEDDECLLSVDEKVEKFIKTAENLTKETIVKERDISRPLIEITRDEDLDTTECIYTPVKLGPSSPQRSPELVRHISRNISRHSDVSEPSAFDEENYDYQTHEASEKDVITRRETKETVTHRKQISNVTPQPVTRDYNDDDDDEELIPHTKRHTTILEERRQKNILTRPSVFDNENKNKTPVKKPQSNYASPLKETVKSTTTTTTTLKSRAKPESPKHSMVHEKTKPTTSTSTITTTNNRKQQMPQQPTTGKDKDVYRRSSVEAVANKPKKSLQPVNKKPDRQSPLRTHTTKSMKQERNVVDDVDVEDVDGDDAEFETVTSDRETQVIINTGTAQRSTTTKTTSNVRKEPTHITNTTHTTRKMKENPISSTCSSPVKNTKTHLVDITERSTHKLNTSTTKTTDYQKSPEIHETFTEKPTTKKPPQPLHHKTKVTTTDSVAARRSLFENKANSQTPRTPNATTPSPGRRPSYMDHTKSSLEHIRRDSLEINKTNYTRKPSTEREVDDDEVPHVDRDTQVKFSVPQKTRKGTEPSEIEEEVNIEEIFDLEILEKLLETVTSYELRRRIRAQIRLVKKNQTNVQHKKSETISTSRKTAPSQPHNNIRDRSVSPVISIHERDSKITTKKEYYYREEERTSSSTHTSPERSHRITTTKVTRTRSPESMKSPSPTNRSRSPQYKQEPSRMSTKVHERYQSPDSTKVIQKVVTSSKHYDYLNEHEEQMEEHTVKNVREPVSPTLRRPSRKSTSPSHPSERHDVDNSKSPLRTKTVPIRTSSRSPDNKVSTTIKASSRNEQQNTVDKNNKRTPVAPVNKGKPEQKAPVWADRRNVLKTTSTSTTPKKPSTAADRTSAKSTTNQSHRHISNKSTYVEDDCITSSYGIGPTDENGLPLFGIRALKKKKPTQEPCETTEEVTGYVVEEKYYSDNKTKPTVERKQIIYSTNPKELDVLNEKVKETSIRKTLRDKKYDDDHDDEPFVTTTISTRSSPEESFLETTTKKYVRRGSVKEMSEKFIQKESSSSVSEKSNNYPKAGLILRTSSRRQSRDSISPEGDNIDYEEEVNDNNEGFVKIRSSEHSSHRKLDHSDSEAESVQTQQEFKKITSSTSSSTRSFLNTKGEEKIITNVNDVLDRMRNADNVVEDGDTPEDQEARALLNKFLGASIIMKGVESSLPMNRETRVITTTSTSSGKQPTKHEVKTTRVTKTIKSGNSSSPVTSETTCDIEEIWDEEILKQLLEQAKTYEERRKIRSRLRELMADQTEQQKSSTSTTEKTETKQQDGAVVTTTTKVTTRTVAGGPSAKTASPFAKFKQLDRQSSQQSAKSPTTPGSGSSSASPTVTGNATIFKFTDPALNARAATVKDQLLQWCQSKTKEYENVQITNFSASWVDGLAFCALIHHFLPDAFDYSQLTPQNRRKNFELAFTVADEKAGIAPLLDVEDMVVMKRPDWKCVFVYVQSIYRRFRNCQ